MRKIVFELGELQNECTYVLLYHNNIVLGTAVVVTVTVTNYYMKVSLLNLTQSERIVRACDGHISISIIRASDRL